MKTLARAIVTGFGLSIGAFLYKKVAKKLGLEEPEKPDLNARDGATDSSLQHQHS